MQTLRGATVLVVIVQLPAAVQAVETSPTEPPTPPVVRRSPPGTVRSTVPHLHTVAPARPRNVRPLLRLVRTAA